MSSPETLSDRTGSVWCTSTAPAIVAASSTATRMSIGWPE